MGLSLRDLAERVGLSHASIKKYEDGLLRPSNEVLDMLAKVLQVSLAYFAPHASSALSLGSIEFRMQGELPARTLDAIRSVVLERLERRMELEALFPQPPMRAFKRLNVAHIHSLDDVEHLAERVRQDWNLGGGPIWGLPDILEENGIHVFPVAFGREHRFDGMTANCGELPLVVIGQGFPGDRQRFTLAHELGHQFLQSAKLQKDVSLEAACNRFAGSFLLPRAVVLRDIGHFRAHIDMQELALIKQRYGISMQAILHRCQELGVITVTTYAEIHAQFRKNGWDELEPGEGVAVEQGHMLEMLERRAHAEGYLGGIA